VPPRRRGVDPASLEAHEGGCLPRTDARAARRIARRRRGGRRQRS
jgi:hypothetical protein